MIRRHVSTGGQVRVAVGLVALATALLAIPLRAGAELLVYEPFDYDDGTILHGTAANGLNLTGEYQATNPAIPDEFQLTVSSPGLDKGNLVGLPGAAGNRLSQPTGTTSNGATVNVDEDVVVNPGDVIFWSALFTFDDSLNGNRLANVTFTNGDNGDVLSFGEPVAGVRAISVGVQTAATMDFISDAADLSFENGETLLLIGRYVNSAVANGDRLDLVGYNTADADMLPASFDPGDPNAEFAFAIADLDIDLTKITSITFTIRGTNNNFIDELRIGTTYADLVIPEPAAGVLLAIGAWASVAVGGRIPRTAVAGQQTIINVDPIFHVHPL